MPEGQPLSFECKTINNKTRLSVRLENGLIVVLPISIKAEKDMGDYENRTLAALQTETGLNFVLDAATNRPDEEVHLDIGDQDKPWFTTAGIKEVDGEIIFFLYHGAN